MTEPTARRRWALFFSLLTAPADTAPGEPGKEPSVAEDVTRIRRHPLVPRHIPIYGYVYEVETGRLREIPEATAAGQAV